MSQRLLNFAAALGGEGGYEPATHAEVFEVSAPVSTAAVLYEKVRATIDYQEEHLLRRNAILRFLRRNLGSETSREELVGQLLKELVWAKYLPNKSVPTSFVEQLVPIFSKYETLLRAADGLGGERESAFNWVLDVFSTELEYQIISHTDDEALVSYMYEEMKARVAWDKSVHLGAEERDLFLFVACHRILLTSNVATLRYRVMTLYYPDWAGASNTERITEISGGLRKVMAVIDQAIFHPITQKLQIQIRRKAGVFRVVYDVAKENKSELKPLIEDPELMDAAVSKALTDRTKKFKGRLSRTVLRAIGFLFITKMLLALIIEVPYDLLVEKNAKFYPLAVNIFFHPLFLALISLTVGIAEKQNKIDYQTAVRGLMIGADDRLLNIRVKIERRGFWSNIFAFVYALLFLVVYGAIAWALGQFGFNWLSTTLFLFFISLVTFFGIRIRQSVKDIVVSEGRSGFFGTLFDILMLPIVRAGRWLSVKVAKINIFIYFFDFIIEAPFKVAIRIIENWFTFIKEKKEEI